MIRVQVLKNKIKVSGHSGYEENGKDIVCAAVSSIVTTSVNAIIRLEPSTITFEESDGFVEINIITESKTTNTLILNMVDLLKDLEKKYSKYIKIT